MLVAGTGLQDRPQVLISSFPRCLWLAGSGCGGGLEQVQGVGVVGQGPHTAGTRKPGGPGWLVSQGYGSRDMAGEDMRLRRISRLDEGY